MWYLEKGCLYVHSRNDGRVWLWGINLFIDNGIIQYVSFCVWLLSLSIMFQHSSMLWHILVLHSFLWLNNISCLFMYWQIDGIFGFLLLGCLWTTMHEHLCTSFYRSPVVILEYVLVLLVLGSCAGFLCLCWVACACVLRYVACFLELWIRVFLYLRKLFLNYSF